MQECSICGFTIRSLRSRECYTCNLIYHETCYFENRSRSEENCEACAFVISQHAEEKEIIEPECFVCGEAGGSPLKSIEGGKFCHIMCGITSKGFYLETYKKFRLFRNENVEKEKCMKCNKDSVDLLECQFCPKKCHYNCLQSEENYVGQNLSGNLKLNTLLKILEEDNPKEDILNIINVCTSKLKEKDTKFSLLTVCPRETKKYCWCFCGNSSLNDEENNPSIICDKCGRFVHLSCTGMKDTNQIEEYECPGCKIGDKYKRYGRLSDLLEEILRLERDDFEFEDFKTIDSFPYIVSARLKENIQRQKEDVLKYLSIKAINQIALLEKKSEIDPKTFYELVRYSVESGPDLSEKELWSKYCQMLVQLEPSMAITITLMNPPKQKENEKEKEHEEKFVKYLGKLRNIFEGHKPFEELGHIVKYIRTLRQIIRQSWEIRNGVEVNLKDNKLFALLTFKCSASSEETVLFQLLNIYFEKEKINHQELEQMEILKKKGCPNFELDESWKIVLNSLHISEDETLSTKIASPSEEEEERPLFPLNEDSEKEKSNIILKILENKEANEKLYAVLKRKIEKFKEFRNKEKEKKLRLLYQWTLLSRKVHFGFEKKKMSSYGISFTDHLMNKCSYPHNTLWLRLEEIKKDSIKIEKIMKKIEANTKLERVTMDYELYFFIKKPTLIEVREIETIIKEEKYPEMWLEVEKIELKKLLEDSEKLEDKVSEFEHNFEKNKQNVVNLEKGNLKKELYSFPISIVNAKKHYQILNMMNTLETCQRINQWNIRKEEESAFENELIRDMHIILNQARELENGIDIQLSEILVNEDLLEFFVNHESFEDCEKNEFFLKHVERNKKWLEAADNLYKRKMKTLKYEEFCSLENKMKTSLFDHREIIEYIFTPIRKEYEQTIQQLQEIIPYCESTEANYLLKENIYNPQNRIFKRIRELPVKGFSIRLYEKDCEILKNLMTVLQRLCRKSKEDIRTFLKEFEENYKSISPYLHQIKILYELVGKIFEKLIEIYKEEYSEKSIYENQVIYQKINRLWIMFDYMALNGGTAENIRNSEKIKESLESSD